MDKCWIHVFIYCGFFLFFVLLQCHIFNVSSDTSVDFNWKADNLHHWPLNEGADVYVNFNVNVSILIMVFWKKQEVLFHTETFLLCSWRSSIQKTIPTLGNSHWFTLDSSNERHLENTCCERKFAASCESPPKNKMSDMWNETRVLLLNCFPVIFNSVVSLHCHPTLWEAELIAMFWPPLLPLITLSLRSGSSWELRESGGLR